MEIVTSTVNASSLQRVENSKELFLARTSDVIKHGPKSRKRLIIRRHQDVDAIKNLGIRKPGFYHKLVEKRLIQNKARRFIANSQSFTRENLGLYGTPDGFFLKRTRGKKGRTFAIPVEIKTSRFLRNKTVLIEKTKTSKYPLKLSKDGRIRLKTNSLWWRQVQVYCLICQATYGYLAIMYKMKIHLLKIKANNDYFSFIRTVIDNGECSLIHTEAMNMEQLIRESMPSSATASLTPWAQKNIVWGDGVLESIQDSRLVLPNKLFQVEDQSRPFNI